MFTLYLQLCMKTLVDEWTMIKLLSLLIVKLNQNQRTWAVYTLMLAHLIYDSVV